MSTQPFNSDGGFGTTANVTGANLVASSNFVGTRLVTNLTGFNWSDPIVDITLGTNTYVTLTNNVFGDPWSGQVTISGVGGTTNANGNWYYAATSGNQFELLTNGGADPVDSSEWGAYTGGGLAFTLDYANIEINGQNITIRSDKGDYNNRIWGFNNNGGTIFPTLSVQRGDNPSGTISGQTLLFGDNGQEAIISTQDGAAGTEYSQRLVINPGQGYNYGEGGDLYLWAGRGGDGSGSGGDIKIRGGQGGANTLGGNGGDGGYIRIEAGDAASTGGVAGYVQITGGVAGYVTPGISGGAVTITGGQGQNGDGGDANITGGYGGTGYNGGDVNITGGGTSSGLANYGNVNIAAGATTWRFDNTGNLNLPQTGIIHETDIPFGGLSGKTIALKPYGGTSADQQLLVYPTAGADANHLHLTSGNLYNTELFLGNDDLYVKLANTGDVVINSNDGGGNTAQWTFATDGNLTTPGSSGNITGANVISAVTFNATSSANVLTLQTRNGDDATGTNHLTQVTFGWNNSQEYPQWIATRHNNSPLNNSIDFYTSDGNANATFPANAILGGSITQGAMQLAVYANTTVRDSVITSPQPGMMIYVTGTGMQVRGATSWNTILGSGT